MILVVMMVSKGDDDHNDNGDGIIIIPCILLSACTDVMFASLSLGVLM